jgi:hypothetical protein
MHLIGRDLATQLGEDDEFVEEVTLEALEKCFNLKVNWQVRIVATGADNFFSDISISATGNSDGRYLRFTDEDNTDLQFGGVAEQTPVTIDFFLGFFAEPNLGCTGSDGSGTLAFSISNDLPNLGDLDAGMESLEPDEIFVAVDILKPPTISCDLPGTSLTMGNIMHAFHNGAMYFLDRDTVNAAGSIQLAYQPGGGEIARFEQGSPVDGEGLEFNMVDLPPDLSPTEVVVPTGKFELWRLISVYNDS